MRTFLTLACLALTLLARGQDTAYTGAYGTGDSILAHVISYGKNLYIDLPHYGKRQLAREGKGRYTIIGFRPKVTLVFDSTSLTAYQKGDFTYLFDPGPADTSMPDTPLPASPPATARTTTATATATTPAPSPWVGRYTQDIDIYSVHHITASAGTLALDGDTLIPVRRDRYRQADQPGDTFELVAAGHGRPRRLIIHTTSPHTFRKISGITGAYAINEHASGQAHGFTRADTLLGMLTPLRTCYDALFYNLDIKIDPDTRSIRGNVLIRFRILAPFDSLQIDLAPTMTIDSLLYHDRPLTYTREYTAVYVHFPHRINYRDTGQIEELRVIYHGSPRQPDLSILKGGFFWLQDRNRHPLIQSVCQGTGASLWWPCKDHNSDKPDSVRISITVPRGLTDVSNGHFLDSVDLPGGWTRWDWYVSYPINVYNVVANIGRYVHFGSTYIHGTDTIPLNFYVLPYHLDKGRYFASQVPPMLDLYEQDFGPYPFPKDGYGLVESIWQMEHQGAVSIGIFGQGADLHSLWHESAHEYWGNSVTCRDFADFWIHESFATYAEVLNLRRTNPDSALRYLKAGVPNNFQPVIGVYNVNNFHWGDVYTKGPWMIYTLQHCIDNDSLWFSILRGIQKRYRYGTVTTDDIVAFFNQATHTDYTPVFDQYLRYKRIPELVTRLTPNGSDLEVQYYWKVDVPGFAMPVKIARVGFIHPTTTPQTLTIPNMRPEDFQVDTDDFYITPTVTTASTAPNAPTVTTAPPATFSTK